MPLGRGFSAEEQLTGEAEHGGLQIVVYPMKRSVFERRFPKGDRLARVMTMEFEPPTAQAYEREGLPWFEYYDEGATAVEDSDVLAGLKSGADGEGPGPGGGFLGPDQGREFGFAKRIRTPAPIAGTRPPTRLSHLFVLGVDDVVSMPGPLRSGRGLGTGAAAGLLSVGRRGHPVHPLLQLGP